MDLFIYPNRDNVKNYLSKLTDDEIENLLNESKPSFLINRIIRSQPGWDDCAHNDTQSNFDIVLISHGPNKINCIKILREEKIADGLKEAKDMSENCPVKMLKGISYQKAHDLRKKFSEIGAIVEIY